MPDLLRIPFRALDLATRPTRFVVGKLLELRRSDDDQHDAPPVARPEPPQSAPEPAPAPAKPRAKAKPKPSPKAARRATRHEPTKGEAAAMRAEDHPTGPSIEVAEPWEGYDAMTEEQVLDRLTGAEPAVRAIVRLYESNNGGRRQILIATEEVTAG